MPPVSDEQGTEESLVTRTFLNLERIDPLIYRSRHLFKPFQGRAVFGGLVVGQALVAASNTVSKGREAHSLHCYFLRPASIENPILYQVLKMRDGVTYSNRFVRATQLGKSIFTMMVSFKETEANNFSHQFVMPEVPGPEGLMEVNDLLRLRLGKDIGYKERHYIEHRLSQEMTVERKPVDPKVHFNEVSVPARQCTWMKASGYIGNNPQIQKCAAAYMSDLMLLGTAVLRADSQRDPNSRMFMTSVDHSVWFHHSIKADEWLLYEMESPQCGHGRAHTQGRVWTRDGTLVMSVAQEGVVRQMSRDAIKQTAQEREKSKSKL